MKNVFRYHERSKHHPYRYARSPGYIDWSNEPDPFRRYEGTPLIELPLLERDPGADRLALYERKNPFHPFSLRNVSAFLELSLGLSAWKSYRGSSWALRMNPSSGNLHPTEAHLILPPLPDNSNRGGVFHYNPFYHALEERATFDEKFWSPVRRHFDGDGFFIGLSSIYWRESWKYGERAFRYCLHDAGHAAACLSFSGNLLGWKITCLNALSDEDIGTMLGFRKTRWKKFEREESELLAVVHGNVDRDVPRDIPPEIIRSFESLTFTGEPNMLSKEHADWKVIDEVSSATVKPGTAGKKHRYGEYGFFEKEAPLNRAAKIIRQRRSALAYDGKTSMPRDHFFGALEKTLPRNGCAPFDLEVGDVSVHLLLFVHKVTDVESGLYFFLRHEKDFDEIKKRCRPDFLWKRIEDGTGTLPLYLLGKGDFRSEGATAGCHQEIAGDGVFSLAMIARFREKVEKEPFLYRHLHWEAGMVGQVLYLEAEAHSMRGTGMGCFFDDVTHGILGLSDDAFQDIYHFAVGKAVEDKRLTTLPPYYHLEKLRPLPISIGSIP